MAFQGVSLRLVTALALALVLSLASVPTMAGSRTLESVVDVDTTAKDATEARTQAMGTVEFDALKSLLHQMNPSGADAIIAKITPQQASGLAIGMEVLEEKITPNRYRAKIKVKFSADRVEALTLSQPVPASAAVSAPTPAAPRASSFLVLPVLKDGPNTYLWEGENLWRSVWESAALQYGTGNVIVPNGNQYDTAMIDAGNVFSAPFSMLQSIAQRYGTSDVLVVQATYGGTDDKPELSLVARHLTATGRKDSTTTYRAATGETRETLLVRAANDMAKSLTDSGRAVAPPVVPVQNVAAVASDAPAENLTVTLFAPIAQLGDWIRIKKRLSDVPLVEGVDLATLSAYEVKILLHYKGDSATLARQLGAAGFRVGTRGNGSWSIE